MLLLLDKIIANQNKSSLEVYFHGRGKKKQCEQQTGILKDKGKVKNLIL